MIGSTATSPTADLVKMEEFLSDYGFDPATAAAASRSNQEGPVAQVPRRSAKAVTNQQEQQGDEEQEIDELVTPHGFFHATQHGLGDLCPAPSDSSISGPTTDDEDFVNFQQSPLPHPHQGPSQLGPRAFLRSDSSSSCEPYPSSDYSGPGLAPNHAMLSRTNSIESDIDMTVMGSSFQSGSSTMDRPGSASSSGIEHLELRRRRNRESMRRARQRKKDEFSAMRELLKTLENQYKKLMKESSTAAKASASQAATSSHPQDPDAEEVHSDAGQEDEAAATKPPSPSPTAAKCPVMSRFRKLNRLYAEVVETCDRLKEENEYLAHEISNYHKSFEQLHQVLNQFCQQREQDHHHCSSSVGGGVSPVDFRPHTQDATQLLLESLSLSPSSSCASPPASVSPPSTPGCPPHPSARLLSQSLFPQDNLSHSWSFRAQKMVIPVERVFETIRESLDQILAFDADDSWMASQDVQQVFGWTARRRMHEDDRVSFAFSKSFVNESPFSLQQRIFSMFSNFEQFRKLQPLTTRLEVLQWVNEDTVVLARDIFRANDNTLYRTICVVFRMQISDGRYALGIRSIKPEDVNTMDELLAGEAVWVDLYYWTVLHHHQLPENAFGCRFNGGGITSSATPLFSHDLFTEVILVILRWENLAIGPLVTMTSL